MHRLLKRQLKKIGLNTDHKKLNEVQLEKLLNAVDQAYIDDDESRYTLQRALEISTNEMQTLFRRLEMTSQQRIDAITNALPDIVLLVDRDGMYHDVISAGGEGDLYIAREEIVGQNVQMIFPSELAQNFLDVVNRAIENNQLEVIEYDLDLEQGVSTFEARVMPTGFKEKGVETAIAVVRNITQKKAAEDSLRLIAKVFEEATEGIMIENSMRNVVSVNAAFLRMISLTEEEVIGQHSDFFTHFLETDILENIYESMSTAGSWQGETVIRHTDKDDLPIWLSIDAVFDKQDKPVNFVIMVTDISEIKRSREKLEFVATHDALTALPNRVLIYDRLESAVLRAKRNEKVGAVLFIDLDDFKEINDNLGHSYGDELLIQCANRLKHVVREEDTVGRLGGDEFLVIVENIGYDTNASMIAESILKRFAEPFTLNDIEYNISVSIGVSMFPNDGVEAETLIGAADIAMYNAKNGGKDGYRISSASLNREANRSFSIDQAIKRAQIRDDFFLLYQPQIDLASGRVTSVEALVRINSEHDGILKPEKFIATAEQNGSIIKIGKWVIEHVCLQIQRWKTEGVFDFNVAINLSTRQLNDDTLIDFIKRISRKYEIQSGELEFEVRESTLSHSGKTATENMKQLYTLGYKLVIDDFGSGHSSLANLKMFSLDKLKIDRHFISELLTDEEDQAIIEATIALGKSFGLKVIAEGVENEEQKAFLHEKGCDEIQGYLFSKPVSSDEITVLVKERNY